MVFIHIYQSLSNVCIVKNIGYQLHTIDIRTAEYF